jgi:hypothetical protein
MGYNTTVVVMNDALQEIASDPEFGKKLAAAICKMSITEKGKIVDVRAGYHMNAAHVVETHHADQTVVVTVGGNLGKLKAQSFGWDDSIELQAKLMKQWADQMGYKLIKKPEPSLNAAGVATPRVRGLARSGSVVSTAAAIAEELAPNQELMGVGSPARRNRP